MASIFSRLGSFWTQPFTSIKLYRSFRFVWLGSVSEHLGEFMEIAALLWLVNQMTHSLFDVTLVLAIRQAPMAIFSFLGGVTVDRLNRRLVLQLSLVASIVLSLALMFLARTGTIAIWNILIVAALGGVATSFNHPARQTIVPNVVKREHLMNAIALDSTSVMASRILGMPIAGFLIAWFGVIPVFGLRALGAFTAIMWLSAVPPLKAASDGQRHNPAKDLREGFRYLGKEPVIRTQVFFYALPMFANIAFMALIPYFSTEVLKVGAAGYGFLQAAPGLGSLITQMTIATMGNVKRRGMALLFYGAMAGVAVIAFSFSSWYALSIIFAIAIGSFTTSMMIINNTVIQEMLTDQMRGRVMSLREVMMGVSPSASLLFGWVGVLAGGPVAGVSMGLSMLAVPVILFLSRSRIRNL